MNHKKISSREFVVLGSVGTLASVHYSFKKPNITKWTDINSWFGAETV